MYACILACTCNTAGKTLARPRGECSSSLNRRANTGDRGETEVTTRSKALRLSPGNKIRSQVLHILAYTHARPHNISQIFNIKARVFSLLHIWKKSKLWRQYPVLFYYTEVVLKENDIVYYIYIKIRWIVSN